MADQQGWTAVEQAPPAGWTPVQEDKSAAERFYEKSPAKPIVDEVKSRDWLRDPIGIQNHLARMGKAALDPIAAAVKAGDYTEAAKHVVKALSSIADPAGTMITDAATSIGQDVAAGNLAGAGGTGSQLLFGALSPEVRAAGGEAAPIVKAAGVGAYRGGMAPVPSGLGFDVPASIKGAVGAGMGAELLQVGIPHSVGPVVGALAPVVKGAYAGASAAMDARTAARNAVRAKAATEGRVPLWGTSGNALTLGDLSAELMGEHPAAAGVPAEADPMANFKARASDVQASRVKRAFMDLYDDTSGALRLPGSGRAAVPGANSLGDLTGAAKALAERKAGVIGGDLNEIPSLPDWYEKQTPEHAQALQKLHELVAEHVDKHLDSKDNLGLRVQSAEEAANTKVGSTLRKSWHNPDGVREKRLPGTAAFNVYDSSMVPDAINNMKPYLRGEGDRLVLVGSDDVVTDHPMEDPGSVVMPNAKLLSVIGTLRKNPARADISAPEPAPALTGTAADLANPKSLVAMGLDARRNALRDVKLNKAIGMLKQYNFTPDLVDSISPRQWSAVEQTAGIEPLTPTQITELKARFKEMHK